MSINDQLDASIKRFDFFIKTLKEIIERIEPSVKDNLHWWTFGVKMARKFLIQTTTLQTIFLSDVIFDGDDEKNRIIDFSSIFILLRGLSETYATYYHLFMPCENIEENIIRFRLWELDGYLSRQKQYLNRWDPNDKRLIEENNYIENVKHVIKGFNFFSNLPENKQDYLIKYTAWRFSTESLNQSNKRYWKSSISQLLKQTDIKESIYSEMYYEFSNHAHSGFLSVAQNNLITQTEKIQHLQAGILFASYYTCFMIVGLKKRYSEAKEYYSNIDKEQQSIIDSFIESGQR